MKNIQMIINKVYRSDYFPFFILTLMMLILHNYLNYNYGDDLWFKTILIDQNFSIFDYINWRYHTWSSRLIIETLMIGVLNLNVWVWRSLDISIIALLCYSISKIFIVENKRKNNWLIIILFCLYPFTQLSSAGWVATTMNYLWPLGLGLFSIIPIAMNIRNEKCTKIELFFYTIALIIACNVEQMAAILTVIYFLFLIYALYTKKCYRYLIVQCIIAISSLIFILTCPGNSFRKASEIINWFPDYEMLDVVDKLRIGIFSPITHFLNYPNIIITIYASILLILVWNKFKNKKLYRITAIIPLLSCIILGWIPYLLTYASFYKDNYYLFVKQLITYSYDTSNINFYIMMFVLIISIVSFIICTIFIFEGSQKLWIILLTLAAGFVSKVVIAFSPTVYVSGDRPNIYLYFSIIITLLMLINEVEQILSKKYKLIFNIVLISIGYYMFLSTISQVI